MKIKWKKNFFFKRIKFCIIYNIKEKIDLPQKSFTSWMKRKLHSKKKTFGDLSFYFLGDLSDTFFFQKFAYSLFFLFHSGATKLWTLLLWLRAFFFKSYIKWIFLKIHFLCFFLVDKILFFCFVCHKKKWSWIKKKHLSKLTCMKF